MLILGDWVEGDGGRGVEWEGGERSRVEWGRRGDGGVERKGRV